jgi:hypothetical protein
MYKDSFNQVNVVLNKLDECIKSLHGCVKIDIILVTPNDLENESTLAPLANDKYKEKLPLSRTTIKFINKIDQMLNHIDINDLFNTANGNYYHNQSKWIEFFQHIELFQNDCLRTGRLLVSTINEIRVFEKENCFDRRQLHSQYRVLHSLLSDSETQILRSKGPKILTQLRNLYTSVNDAKSKTSRFAGNSKKSNDHGLQKLNILEQRLSEVETLFQEVENAAKVLEQIFENRKEHLKDLTRQRTLQDEIQEVSVKYLKYL